MENQRNAHAVLFADVSGSTHLYEALGDRHALECVELCLEIMRDATREHGGRVIRTIGDELMCVFPDASSAALAAAQMQAKVALQQPVQGERLAIRIGAHFGPVIEKFDDIYGDIVNVAARMVSVAKAGQVITTQDFVDTLPLGMRAMTRSLDALQVKGKQEEIAICELVPEGSEDMTMLAFGSSDSQVRLQSQVRLRLTHIGREIVAGPEVKLFTFGRELTNDFPLCDAKASRQHARIERHRDKYVLVDTSSNGTYVTFQGQPEMALRREEAVLQGRGSISFGHRYCDDPTQCVAFQVET
jgi:class 3 adenylate cyclase